MDKRLKIDVGCETPAQRMRTWKALLHDNFMGLECRADAEDLRGAVDGRILDGSSISKASISRQTLTRTPSLIRREEMETVTVVLGTGGTFASEQSGASTVVGPGDLCVLDGSRPFELRVASAVAEHDILLVPKAAITQRFGRGGEAGFGTFHAGQPLQKLVAAFMQGMVASLDEVDAATLNRLVDQLLDLLALMVGQRRNGAVAPSTHRSAMRLRIKAHAKAHLKDPALTIEAAAAALGISSRYVNALLADEATSFGRYVLAERLEGARREIMDPAQINRQVTEVAFDWGFNSTSHFGRAYKERFGRSPRDAKLAGRKP